MYLVDPYHPGRIPGVNLQEIVARRLVRPVGGRRVRWIKMYSFDAAASWTQPIDFLFIDADHSYEHVRRDWEDWSRFVIVGGCIALHDARVFEGGWITQEDGPVRLAGTLTGSPGWQLIDCADSTVVFRRMTSEGGLVDQDSQVEAELVRA